MKRTLDRAANFCEEFGLKLPVLLGPMAGVSSPSLSIAVANAGGLGACGVLLMQPAEILEWARQFSAQATGAFQLNVWIPDPEPERHDRHEAKLREFLGRFGPPVPSEAGNARPPNFEAQLEAMLEARPPILSSVMGLYPPGFVDRMRGQGIKWFANVSTVAEARAAEDAGADVVVVQGAEAGGHRGCFDARDAERGMVGLISLVPTVVAAVKVPVVATGGIADGKGLAAALVLGASAVQIGTGFLRCPEANIPPAWADALAKTAPENTTVSRVFSGRAGRSIATAYVREATRPGAPVPAPYPIQRGLTAAMRGAAIKEGDVERMQAWAGQSASLAKVMPAERLAADIWREARELLR